MSWLFSTIMRDVAALPITHVPVLPQILHLGSCNHTTPRRSNGSRLSDKLEIERSNGSRLSDKCTD